MAGRGRIPLLAKEGWPRHQKWSRSKEARTGWSVRRTLRKVLVAMNRAARDIDVIAGLHNPWLLTLDRESDFAFLHRPPLVARVSMELVAGTRRNDDVLQTHDARWILFERHHEIRL